MGVEIQARVLLFAIMLVLKLVGWADRPLIFFEWKKIIGHLSFFGYHSINFQS